jgi:hypothetical protein
MITRNKDGGIKINILDVQILFDDLLDIAKNEEEVDFIFDTLQEYLEICREDKIDSLD